MQILLARDFLQGHTETLAIISLSHSRPKITPDVPFQVDETSFLRYAMKEISSVFDSLFKATLRYVNVDDVLKTLKVCSTERKWGLPSYSSLITKNVAQSSRRSDVRAGIVWTPQVLESHKSKFVHRTEAG